MRITVIRSGGFAGLVRRATLDTEKRPDAAELASLARTALTEAAAAPPTRVVPDGFHYEVDVDGEEARFADPGLTQAQSALVRKVLKEGS
jgi:hypothetical protein